MQEQRRSRTNEVDKANMRKKEVDAIENSE